MAALPHADINLRHLQDFAVVANTPGMTERAIVVWLQTSHPTMPNFMIPEEARDDLVAYIMSLKARSKPQ